MDNYLLLHLYLGIKTTLESYHPCLSLVWQAAGIVFGRCSLLLASWRVAIRGDDTTIRTVMADVEDLRFEVIVIWNIIIARHGRNMHR